MLHDNLEQNPLITTIIPTFRRPYQLKKALQSVLRQTCRRLVVCVYDNASGDETASIVAEVAQQDPRVQYFCHPQNVDAAPNFQYGMERVSTPFFSFLSDDDILLPEFYEQALAGFAVHPEAMFWAGCVIDITDKGQIVGVSKIPPQERELKVPPEGLFSMIQDYINWTGIVFRQEVIQKLGPLETTVKPFDVDFVLRAAANYPYIVSQKPVALFIQHATSYSGHCGMKLIYPSWLRIMDHLRNERSLSKSDKLKAEALMKMVMYSALTSIAVRSILQKKMHEISAIVQILKRLDPADLRGKVIHWATLFSHHSYLLALFRSLLYVVFITRRYVKIYRTKKRTSQYANLTE